MNHVLGSGLLCLALIWPSLASANHHQWIITELFSNADGTVQFVELVGVADGEPAITGFTIDTSPTGTTGSIMTSASLAGPPIGSSNNGQYYLVGTVGYATLAAAQNEPPPDATLPDDFLELGADTVRYAGIATSDVAYSGSELPTNGIDSLDVENPTGTTNTPQNSSGDMGSIDASAQALPVLPQHPLVLVVILLLLGAAGALVHRRIS